jgi:hypothetical protein
LRLLTRNGLTNPVVFQVGQLPEVREQKAKTDIAPKEQAVTLPTVINGQIMPGRRGPVPVPPRARGSRWSWPFSRGP